MKKTPEDHLLHQLAKIAAERAEMPEKPEQDDPRLAQAEIPLGEAAKARIVASLEQIVPDQPSIPAPLPFPAERSKKEAAVLSSHRWLLPLAAVLTVMLGFLVYRSITPPALSPASAVTLPSYSIQISGTIQAQRGAVDSHSSGVLEIASGNRLQVILTPELPTGEALEARAHVLVDGSWRSLAERALAVSAQGAVRFDAMVGVDLELSPPPERLLLVIAPGSDVPSAAQAATATGDPAPWRSFLFDLVVIAP